MRAWSAQVRRKVVGQLDCSIDGLVAARAAVLMAEKESEACQGAAGNSVRRDSAQLAQGQQELVALAKRLDAGACATAAARWAASVDPAGLEADHQAQRAARYLQVVDTARAP